LLARLVEKIRSVVESLDRQRASEAGSYQQEAAVRDRLFGAIQEVYGKSLEEIDRQAAQAIEVYRSEAVQRQQLLSVTEEVKGKLADAEDRKNTAQHEVYQIQTAAREGLLQQIQQATTGVIEGRARGNELRQSNGTFLSQGLHQLAALQTEIDFNNLRTQADQNAREMELMKYQVDTVNNLVVGLFGFQEKREDSYPALDLIAQLVSQMGDEGATSWITP
jgi:hypothetical protein